MIESCPVCGNFSPANVVKFENMPVLCNQLWESPAKARSAPSGPIDLSICSDCAFIWNRMFDPALMVYASGYENALHHSATFRTFAEGLAAKLVETYALQGKDVAEVGCGDGYFLDLMVRSGAATATGFDPTMDGRETAFVDGKSIVIVPEYFDERQLDRPFHIVICRHVLEHLDEPVVLLSSIRKAIGARDVPVYFEVPNAEWMMDKLSLWDVIYEHFGYWTKPSMTRAFRDAGFEVLSIRPGYNDQFLMIEARPGFPGDQYDGTSQIAALARRFGIEADGEIARWRERLSDLGDKTAVIWGAGSKGISFANAIGSAGQRIAALVDLNPRKHGLFAPLIAKEVVGPDALRQIRPDLVLISNSLYRSEIMEQVRELGLSPEFGVIAG